MKHYTHILLFILILTGCQRRNEIVILFDNDVHCRVEGYAQMASLRTTALRSTPFVSCVSSGDFAQGDVIGSISLGEYIVQIMNAVPYDVVTLGNHEFDYGVTQQLKLADMLHADVVCCNFTDLRTRHTIYPAYSIHQYGPTQVAYIGIATPYTINSSTPTLFQDSLGQFVYSFHPDDVAGLVQQAACQARKQGADYVIVLSHLGDNGDTPTSVDIIASTYGIDAVLDGHQHNTFVRKVANANGDSVVLASTGTRMDNIGQLTIPTNGPITCRLICTQDTTIISDAKVTSCTDSLKACVQNQTNEIIGYTSVTLTDSDSEGNRLVRSGETNLSQLIADAFRHVGQADIGMIHGGSIRTSIPAGPITTGQLMAVLPFNNYLTKVEMTGQQLYDAMEVAVALWPLENGDFHTTSGMRYTINPSIASSVQWDEQHLFVGVGNTRRVTCIEIQRGNQWQPIDPNQSYTIAGLNYTLLNQGADGMFRYAKPLPFTPIKDIDCVRMYINDNVNVNENENDNLNGNVKEKRFIVKNTNI